MNPPRPLNLPAVSPVEPAHIPTTLTVPGQLLGVGPYGGPPPQTRHASHSEFWEAMHRRKFVVILMAIVGVGLGYLAYTKQPDVFESTLKLQITSQAPPSLVNGDMVVQKISAPRHLNLLTSELVLSLALNDRGGRLQSLTGLRAFEGSENPVATLKESFNVTNLTGTDDTLLLALTGPYAEELPRILNNIVESYTSILEEDNRAVGKESIELIEKLQQRLLDEKTQAEERYLKLIKDVGPVTQPNGKVLENPFAARLTELMAEQRQDEMEQQSVLDRLLVVTRARNSNDELQIRVAAMGALKSMGLDYEQNLESVSSDKGELEKAENKMNDLSEENSKLVEERWDLRRTYGSGHPQMRLLNKRMGFLKQDLEAAVNEWEQLRVAETGFDEKNTKTYPAENGISKQQKKRQTELQWIDLYVAQLDSDAKRLGLSMERRGDELATVRQDAAKVAGNVVELNILQTQIDEKRDAVRIILERLSEINVLSTNYNMVKVRLLDRAGPGIKIAPSLPKSIGLGVLIASALGVGLALLIDRADLSFRGPHEIIDRFGVPVMGLIPREQDAGKKGKRGVDPMLSHQSSSPFTESFRRLRTALFYAASQEDARVILCASPSQGDGKSTTACNLAISMAVAGKRVLLIDADMRRPRVNQYLGQEACPGLSEYLEGKSSLKEVVRRISSDNLFVITSGSRVNQPGEMIGHPKLSQLLRESRETYDFVIVDSPPVLLVADSCVLASQVDGVLLVLRIRKGIKMTSHQCGDVLIRSGAKILGVVVNGLDENPHYHEFGNYHYGYTNSTYSSRQTNDRPYALKHDQIADE